MIRFGSAGNPDAFYEQGGKSSLETPKWLADMGLSAYEYQCGKGVKISEESAKKLGINAKAYDVALSIHAPYYTNISSNEQERIDKTIDYIMQTAIAANCMGAQRIVVHMGAAKNITRKEAMEISKSTMNLALKTLEENKLSNIIICPETMGKINQMGTLDEVMELCKIDERLIPTIDFGHLNSRNLGALKSENDFDEVISTIENKLGNYRAKNFHCHFSRIEFTKSGEKKHLTFEDKEWGPDFAPLSKVLAKRGLTPTIICESAGTQAVDALAMKRMFEMEEGVII